MPRERAGSLAVTPAQAQSGMAVLARHLSLGGMGPDVTDVRRLLQQAEQQEAELSSASLVAGLDGAEPAAVALARVRANEEFSRAKLNLLEQETKKRLLEQLLSAGELAPSAEAVAQAETQMHERKAAAKRAKAESKELRDKLVEHAHSIAEAKRSLKAEGAALLALVSSRKTDEKREVEAKTRLLEHGKTIERLALEAKSEEAAADLAEAELEGLREQLAREQARRAQLVLSLQGARDEVRQADQQLQGALEQQANASQVSADAAW
ncbi:hypothetical protein T492DRAFT_851007 [Pavlovales sp. CCMP2436]|nr:hypothetical protein T492DRAFT_851007 [Pavlovales sp. CCMP2436]